MFCDATANTYSENIRPWGYMWFLDILSSMNCHQAEAH